MSTPPTPAGWYPDPDDSGSQRYWDGSAWTEHRAPVHAPSEPAVEQPTVVVPTRPASSEGRGGAHRKPDTEPVEPEPTEPEPGVTAPVAQWTPPPLEPEAPTYEQAPPTLVDAPRSFEQAPPSFEPAAFAAPPAGPSAPGDNKKLIMWFSAACAGLLAVLILVLVYALFLHDPGKTEIASPTTAPTETAADEPTTETSAPGWGGSDPTAPPTETQAPAGGESVDGPLAFTLITVETGDTVTSSDAPVEKTAQGEYVVVRLTVHNTGAAPAQFLGTLQRLHAGGTTYNIDDEATFYVGGGFVEIPPGGDAVVGVAFDVPPGTVGEAIELHFDPLSPGVQLPL